MARTEVRLFATVAAAIGWAAVILQFALSLQLAVGNGRGVGWGLFVFFGFFTILTNVVVAIALSMPQLAPRRRIARWLVGPGVTSAIAAAIAVVGLAYFFLLRKIWEPRGLQWLADGALHYVMPVLFLVYWWLAVPAKSLRWGQVPAWALYPLAYLVYALARGAMTGHYPYPFIDVTRLGYPAVLLNALGLLLGFAVVSAVLVAVNRMRPHRAPRAGRPR